MSYTTPPPIVPPADGDDETRVLGEEEEQPLDPDANEDLQDSADADERRATEGTLDGDVDEG